MVTWWRVVEHQDAVLGEEDSPLGMGSIHVKNASVSLFP